MTSKKKSRMSLLDNLAAAKAPAPTTAASMMASNRALRSARDAVDSHHVWELDPTSIIDDRLNDRLDPEDVLDLRDAIETNGQTVPILVRRHPSEADRYLLVYGRRRLEAIRQSDKVDKVRALVANLDDQAAVRAQISENMARRDLSYIEKALFAQELISSGFGNQSQVAEVLTVTKSSISMAKTVVEMVGTDIIHAVGPAHGVGRPRWEALGKGIEESGADRHSLAEIAEHVYHRDEMSVVTEDLAQDPADLSVLAFEAVEKAVQSLRPARPTTPPSPAARGVPTHSRVLRLGGQRGGSVKRTKTGITISLDQGAFADWVEGEAEQLIEDLHAQWIKRAED
ncbi:MAG: plasmid partitioning protein RepB [Marinibacterium sp.]|nr:plasmid partitioning protein RepB [Marinibacterium sp.]